MKTLANAERHAFAYEALMLRALHAYRSARDNAKNVGVDISTSPEPASFSDLSRRYDALLDEWATEDPDTHDAMAAYLDLVAAIVDGERAEQRGDECGGILATERDFGHALTLLTSVRRKLNKKGYRNAGISHADEP